MLTDDLEKPKYTKEQRQFRRDVAKFQSDLTRGFNFAMKRSLNNKKDWESEDELYDREVAFKKEIKDMLYSRTEDFLAKHGIKMPNIKISSVATRISRHDEIPVSENEEVKKQLEDLTHAFNVFYSIVDSDAKNSSVTQMWESIKYGNSKIDAGVIAESICIVLLSVAGIIGTFAAAYVGVTALVAAGLTGNALILAAGGATVGAAIGLKLVAACAGLAADSIETASLELSGVDEDLRKKSKSLSNNIFNYGLSGGDGVGESSSLESIAKALIEASKDVQIVTAGRGA